jgi:hypothetical protein
MQLPEAARNASSPEAMDLPALTSKVLEFRDASELGAVPQPAQPDRFAESRSQRTARADAVEERRRHGAMAASAKRRKRCATNAPMC